MDGPDNIDDLLFCVPDIVRSLGVDEFFRIIAGFLCGLRIRTYYTGIDCVGVGLHMIVSWLIDNLRSLPFDICLSAEDIEAPGNSYPTTHIHACELDETCIRILSEWEHEPSRAKHLFGDMTKRIPAELLDEATTIQNKHRAEYIRLRDARKVHIG